jgi:hypothetical protein
MNKPKSKAKLSLVSSRKSSSKIKEIKASQADSNPTNEEAALEQLASVQFWKQEILNLQHQEFETVEKAIEKVIEQVLERMHLKDSDPDSENSDLREFLRLVFDSSEALQTALRKSLKINS